MGNVIHAEARFIARRIKADTERSKPDKKLVPKTDPRTRRLQALVDKEKKS